MLVEVGARRYACQAVDISAQGAKVSPQVPLRSGTEVRLQFVPPDGPLLRLSGRWCKEVFFMRFHAIVENDELKMYFHPDAAERFAEDRQYYRSDGREALAAFRRRRDETLKFLGTLMPGQRQRAGIRGDRRITIDEFVSVMAWHDDNHLDQLKRALEGRP